MTPFKMKILVKLSLALPLLPNFGDNLKWDQRVRQLTECDLLLSLYLLPLLPEDLALPPLEREDIGLFYPHQGWSVMCHGFLKDLWK